MLNNKYWALRIEPIILDLGSAKQNYIVDVGYITGMRDADVNEKRPRIAHLFSKKGGRK